MAKQRNYNVETSETNSPTPIAHALKGIDFPADKQDLLDQAEENDAREEVMDMIDRMPEQEYQSMADVIAGAGEINDDESEEEYEASSDDEEFYDEEEDL